MQNSEQKKVTVVTHSGTYHADDVFAVATLFLVYEKEEKTIEVVRSRKEEDITRADIVLDVGGIYDPILMRFDHHQKGGAGIRDNGVPYASFGIIWKEFGPKLCSPEVVTRIDEAIVQQVDGRDNGIEMFTPLFEGIYPLSMETFFKVNAHTWNEGKENFDEAFMQSVDLAKHFLARLLRHNESSVAAEATVEAIYVNAADKQLIILDTYVPWGTVLGLHLEPLFVIYPRIDGTWAVEAIRVEKESFKNRKNLPATWGGLRDEELATVTGVSDAVFCHNGLFLCVAKSRVGAVALAEKALAA